MCQNLVPFKGMYSVPLYVDTAFCLFIHLLIDTGSFSYVLAVGNDDAMDMCVQIQSIF